MKLKKTICQNQFLSEPDQLLKGLYCFIIITAGTALFLEKNYLRKHKIEHTKRSNFKKKGDAASIKLCFRKTKLGP